jgi:acyl carrier protein
MQKEEIIQKINSLLVTEIEIDEEQISPDADLKKDLGIDSLDFGFKMKAEEMAGVKTLQDFYDYIIIRVNPN